MAQRLPSHDCSLPLSQELHTVRVSSWQFHFLASLAVSYHPGSSSGQWDPAGTCCGSLRKVCCPGLISALPSSQPSPRYKESSLEPRDCAGARLTGRTSQGGSSYLSSSSPSSSFSSSASPHPLSHLIRQFEGSHLQAREQADLSAGTPILDFLASRIMRNKFLLFPS